MSFYSYIHCKPDGAPFYVGKGKKNRVKNVRRKHNAKHELVVEEFGLKNILVGHFECSSEDIAYDLERGLLRRLELMGFDLANQTKGGGGCSGFKMPEEAKKKISAALSGRKFSDTHIENLTKSLRGRHMPPISDYHRKRISETNASVKVGNKYTHNRIWVTNGSQNKMIALSEEVPSGWRRGITRGVVK